MEKTKQNKPGTTLMIAGLFIIAFAQIIGRLAHFPDLIQGFLLGIGLACEILALVKMKKQKAD